MRSVFRGTRMDPGGAISVLTDAPAPEAHVTITICAPAKVRPADTAVDGNLVAPEPGSHKTHRWREMDSNFQYAGTIKLIVAPLRSPRALHRVRKWAGWTIRRRAVESLVVSDNGRYR
jgi:hypothetical protein